MLFACQYREEMELDCIASAFSLIMFYFVPHGWCVWIALVICSSGYCVVLRLCERQESHLSVPGPIALVPLK